MNVSVCTRQLLKTASDEYYVMTSLTCLCSVFLCTTTHIITETSSRCHGCTFLLWFFILVMIQTALIFYVEISEGLIAL